tara:strand:+ start:414 stop:668 length:255 start_codon:yes stop_codon:yes gene_type:complete
MNPMKLMKTLSSIIAAYFIINFAWASYVINTNSKFQSEVEETMRLIYTSQVIALINMRDLTILLINDAKYKLKEKNEINIEKVN